MGQTGAGGGLQQIADGWRDQVNATRRPGSRNPSRLDQDNTSRMREEDRGSQWSGKEEQPLGRVPSRGGGMIYCISTLQYTKPIVLNRVLIFVPSWQLWWKPSMAMSMLKHAISMMSSLSLWDCHDLESQQLPCSPATLWNLGESSSHNGTWVSG